MKISHWYDSNTKPVHIGLYEVNNEFGNGWAVWSGEYWEFFSSDSVRKAMLYWKEGCGKSNIQANRWRGLLNE